MLGLIALAGLLMGGFAMMAVFGLIFMVIRIVFWAVFFPIRLVMKLLWLPFGLIGGLFSLAAGFTLLPILLVAGGIIAAIAAFAALLALVIPMIPFILFGFIVWTFLRRRPVAA